MVNPNLTWWKCAKCYKFNYTPGPCWKCGNKTQLAVPTMPQVGQGGNG